MAYAYLQPIGYSINTLPVEDDGNDLGKKYLGVDDDARDIMNRCNLMMDAIHHASRAADKLYQLDDTLKIFVAPEFYFRGGKGAYPLEQISAIMKTMRALTHQEVFKHWLFVFGTAVAYLDGDNGDKEIFNVAMVQKGGVKTDQLGASNTVVVYKEYISPADFIRDLDANPNWNKAADRKGLIGNPSQDAVSGLLPVQGSLEMRSKKRIQSGQGREQTSTGLGGQSVFEMDGITFGLEICVDHANRRLRSSPPSPGQMRVQVQLVTSAGLQIEEYAVACIKNGVIFNVDGRTPHSDVKLNTGTHAAPVLSDSVDIRGKVALAGKPSHHFFGKHTNYFPDRGELVFHTRQAVPAAQQA